MIVLLTLSVMLNLILAPLLVLVELNSVKIMHKDLDKYHEEYDHLKSLVKDLALEHPRQAFIQMYNYLENSKDSQGCTTIVTNLYNEYQLLQTYTKLKSSASEQALTKVRDSLEVAMGAKLNSLTHEYDSELLEELETFKQLGVGN